MLASRGLGELMPAGPILFLAGLAAGYAVPRHAMAALLAAMCVAPALIGLFVPRYFSYYELLWVLPFAGALLARTEWRRWQLLPRWGVPVALWATTIAIGWLLVAWREADGSWALVFATRPHNTRTGIFPALVVLGVATTAQTLLLALIWLDELCARTRDGSRLIREVVLPIAIGAVVALPIALYQGWVDVGFLSSSVWPSLRRAAGTSRDANVFGMLAALWGPALIALAVGRSRRARLVGAVMYLASLAAVWATGSRTALLAAALGLFLVLIVLVTSGTIRRRTALAAAAAIVAGLAILHGTAPTASPLSRIAAMFPSQSWQAVGAVSRALWERDEYGWIATRMIREYPVAGVGTGAFHTLVSDYSIEAGTYAPPDNAQNWYRHQLAETGLAGSVGWIAWLAILLSGAPRWRSPVQRLTAAALAGFAVASLLGMAGQNFQVALTAMTFVAWLHAVPGSQEPAGARAHGKTRAIAFVALLMFLAGATRSATGDLRPAFRAVRFDFDYMYGFYFDPDVTWTAAHGVTVPRSPKPWMKLTYWVSHPDSDEQPVDVEVWRDRERVVDRPLRRDQRVVEYIRVPGEGKRFVLEVEVDRTWRPSDYGQGDRRELGLGMRWEFVDRRP